MNLESELVFIVGPGGAGKSTTGKLLAQKLNYNFIDIDTAFNQRIAPIPDYVQKNGYKLYCETNSSLVDQLLSNHNSRTVLAMPSGFLVHEDSPHLVKKHKQLISTFGVSILLLPSESLEESVEIIVERQLSRGFADIVAEKERIVITRRHPLYLQSGDIKIFSSESPLDIATLMEQELQKLGLPRSKNCAFD